MSDHVYRGSEKVKTNATLSRGRTGREVGSFAYLRCEAEGSAPAAEPIPHPLRLASSTSGVRDEGVAGEKVKHGQIKGYTNCRTALGTQSGSRPRSCVALNPVFQSQPEGATPNEGRVQTIFRIGVNSTSAPKGPLFHSLQRRSKDLLHPVVVRTVDETGPGPQNTRDSLLGVGGKGSRCAPCQTKNP